MSNLSSRDVYVVSREMYTYVYVSGHSPFYFGGPQHERSAKHFASEYARHFGSSVIQCDSPRHFLSPDQTEEDASDLLRNLEKNAQYVVLNDYGLSLPEPTMFRTKQGAEKYVRQIHEKKDAGEHVPYTGDLKVVSIKKYERLVDLWTEEGMI
jgi:hypothetical protein